MIKQNKNHAQYKRPLIYLHNIDINIFLQFVFYYLYAFNFSEILWQTVAPTLKINDVDMQHNYVKMQFINVKM